MFRHRMKGFRGRRNFSFLENKSWQLIMYPLPVCCGELLFNILLQWVSSKVKKWLMPWSLVADEVMGWVVRSLLSPAVPSCRLACLRPPHCESRERLICPRRWLSKRFSKMSSRSCGRRRVREIWITVFFLLCPLLRGCRLASGWIAAAGIRDDHVRHTREGVSSSWEFDVEPSRKEIVIGLSHKRCRDTARLSPVSFFFFSGEKETEIDFWSSEMTEVFPFKLHFVEKKENLSHSRWIILQSRLHWEVLDGVLDSDRFLFFI